MGVRIFSNNLSGLTTNVTFLPFSGGSIDIGIQVFPFDYLSDYVFGVYNCYVPTYNHTYSLVVPFLDNPILVEEDVYLSIDNNEYLQY